MSVKKDWVISTNSKSDMSWAKPLFVKNINLKGYPIETESLKVSLKFRTKLEAAFMLDDIEWWNRKEYKVVKAELFAPVIEMKCSHYMSDEPSIKLFSISRYGIHIVPNVGNVRKHRTLEDAIAVYRERAGEEERLKRTNHTFKVYCIKANSKSVVHEEVFNAS